MATRDLTYLIDFNVEGSSDLATAAGDMEKLADATNGVSETASLDLDLPETSEIEGVGDALGDLGADGGPVDKASEKAGGLSGAFQTMVGAISLVEVGAAGAEFVMGKITERLDAIKETDAWNAARVQAYADALEGVNTNVEAIQEVLDALSDEPIVENTFGGSEEIPNFAAALGAFGINAEEVIAVIQGGEPELEAFRGRLDDVGASGSFGSQVMGILAGEQEAFSTATTNSAAAAVFYAESQESANRALQDLLDDRAPMGQFTSEWDLLKESMSDGSIDTTAAANALNTLKEELGLTTEQVLELAQADLDEAAAGALAFADALDSIDFQATDIEGATTAFSAYTDGLFAAANEAERREAAFDALAESAEDQALTFNLASEAGRAQSDALEAVARVIDEDLAAAYDNANGSQAEFIASATQIGDETLARLQTELGLTDAQVETLRTTLGLTAADYEARFNLAGAEEARLQLELLGTAIEGLPANIEQTVTQQILAGDFVAARDTVAQYYADNPVVLPAEADTTTAEDDLAGAAEGAPEATIVANADTVQAAEDLLDEADRPRTAYIIADALVGIAQGELDDLTNADRTAYIDVATGTVDLPSNSELRNKIGTIRVPVQLYYNTRIEGRRPV